MWNSHKCEIGKGRKFSHKCEIGKESKGLIKTCNWAYKRVRGVWRVSVIKRHYAVIRKTYISIYFMTIPSDDDRFLNTRSGLISTACAPPSRCYQSNTVTIYTGWILPNHSKIPVNWDFQISGNILRCICYLNVGPTYRVCRLFILQGDSRRLYIHVRIAGWNVRKEIFNCYYIRQSKFSR